MGQGGVSGIQYTTNDRFRENKGVKYFKSNVVNTLNLNQRALNGVKCYLSVILALRGARSPLAL